MAIVSLVLGIVSIVSAVFGLGIPVGVLCGIIGIITGILGKKNAEKAGLAQAGFVCSIIGTILSLAFVILCAGCLGAMGVLGSM